jgi:hypothetical protein
MTFSFNPSRAALQVDEQLIRDLLGDDSLSYLRRKHVGGASGAKGVRYEDVFAAVQIAESARLKGANCGEVTLEAQAALHFIDDLVVSDAGTSRRSYFQLKNTANLSWNAGKHPIAEDCAYQGRLCQAKGEIASECIVVTAEKQVAEQLAELIPAEIRSFTRVQWFPWEESPTLLCERWLPEFSALAWLSKHETPTFQDVADVLGILLGQWVMLGGPVTALDVINAARHTSPTLIRPLVSNEEAMHILSEDFKMVLAGIENFSYSIVKGFFSWKFMHPNGTVTSGVLSYDCLSDQFRALQSRLLRLAHLTFESMEDQLL